MLICKEKKNSPHLAAHHLKTRRVERSRSQSPQGCSIQSQQQMIFSGGAISYMYSVPYYYAATVAKSSGRHRGRSRRNKRSRRIQIRKRKKNEKSPELQSTSTEKAIPRDHRQLFNLPVCADGSRQQAARSSPFSASGIQLSAIGYKVAGRT